ncbi:calcium-binding protein [Enterovibrio coralii]|uniref:DUF4114 domain-containing protein n=1 Tax=Enterovibrio coralii TaxID=294935 RepID=A0A135I8A2_9GAMM|nr:DUF4114 domain-containing protein [Enterovibrio coralii]KXF81680.1 hypothetical protein ATN88_03215 [Enterovibrio coralii]
MAKVTGTNGADVLNGAAGANQSLLMNGDFEAWGNDTNRKWGLFHDHQVSGWYTPGRNKIELQQGSFGGTPDNPVTNTVLELDGARNTWVQQDVDVTKLAEDGDVDLSLSFDYANRYKGNNHSTSQFEVKVFDQDGNVIYSKFFDNTQSNESYVDFDVDFTVPEGTTGITLRFEGKGQSDSYGALIDNIDLTVAPADNINDLIDGGNGDDIINGGAGNDELHGGNGDDTINGGDGDDVIYGGAGENNLLINGDFEDWGDDDGRDWALFHDHQVTGWYTPGTNKIELQQGTWGGAAQNANDNTVLELDSHRNTWIQQEVKVADLTSDSDATLELSFDHANRYRGNDQSTSQFEVKVFDANGNVIYKKFFDNTQSNESYVDFMTEFTVPQGIDYITLRFEAKGKSDSYGALIDNVKLAPAKNNESDNDVINGGNGNDTIYGQHGDDEINGGNGDDIIYGGEESTQQLTLNHVDGATTYALDGEGTVTVNLSHFTHSAAYNNSVGVYGVDADGNIVFAKILADNVKNVSELNMDVDVEGAVEMSFFLIPNGDRHGFDVGDVTLDLSGSSSTVSQGGNSHTVYVSNAAENGDGKDHEKVDGDTSKWEDLWNLGDKDFNDTTFKVTVTQEKTVSDNDVINGGNGNDTIYGGDGDDIINGGNGDDVIYGGAGNDTIYGAGGDDTLYGGEGNDILHAGYEDDIIMDGEAGLDLYIGSEGNDTMFFDQEDFSDETFLSSQKGAVYIGDRGFDKVLVEGDANVDLVGDSYFASGTNTGPNSIAQVEAVIGDEGDQSVTVSVNSVFAQSDDFQTVTNVNPGDWDGFVAYLGQGDDILNLEAGTWSFDENAAVSAEISADMIAFMGLTQSQVDDLDAYVFTRGNDAVTIWTDAETIKVDGTDLF